MAEHRIEAYFARRDQAEDVSVKLQALGATDVRIEAMGDETWINPTQDGFNSMAAGSPVFPANPLTFATNTSMMFPFPGFLAFPMLSGYSGNPYDGYGSGIDRYEVLLHSNADDSLRDKAVQTIIDGGGVVQ